jgi:hypothetical protein
MKLKNHTLLALIITMLSCSFILPERNLVSVYEASMRSYEWQIFYLYDDFTYEFSAWSHTYGNYIYDEGSYEKKDSLLILNSAAAIQTKTHQKQYGGKHFYLCKNLKLIEKDSSVVVLSSNQRIHFKEYFKWNEEDLLKMTKTNRD